MDREKASQKAKEALVMGPQIIGVIRFNGGNKYAVITEKTHNPVPPLTDSERVDTGIPVYTILEKDDFIAAASKLPDILNTRVVNVDPEISEVCVYSAALDANSVRYDRGEGLSGKRQVVATMPAVDVAEEEPALAGKTPYALEEDQLLNVMYGRREGNESGIVVFHSLTRPDDVAIMVERQVSEDGQNTERKLDILFVTPQCGNSSAAGAAEFLGNAVAAFKQKDRNGADEAHMPHKNMWRVVASIDDSQNDPTKERVVMAMIVAEQFLAEKGDLTIGGQFLWQLLQHRLGNLPNLFKAWRNREAGAARNDNIIREFLDDEVQGIAQDFLPAQGDVAAMPQVKVEVQAGAEAIEGLMLKSEKLRLLFKEKTFMFAEAQTALGQEGPELVKEAQNEVLSQLVREVRSAVRVFLVNHDMNQSQLDLLEDAREIYKWLFANHRDYWQKNT